VLLATVAAVAIAVKPGVGDLLVVSIVVQEEEVEEELDNMMALCSVTYRCYRKRSPLKTENFEVQGPKVQGP
jgi:hypothetical protein